MTIVPTIFLVLIITILTFIASIILFKVITITIQRLDTSRFSREENDSYHDIYHTNRVDPPPYDIAIAMREIHITEDKSLPTYIEAIAHTNS